MAEPSEKICSSDPKEQTEFLFKAISRYDFYINTTNAKASLILAWNGVVIGTVLLKFDSFLSLYLKPSWAPVLATVLLLSLGLCSLVSMFIAFRVISPFLAPGTSSHNEGLLFFGSVAQAPLSAYSQEIKRLSTEALLSDLIQQSYILAHGLKKKMNDTKKSVWAIYASLFCLILLLLLKGVTVYAAPL